MLARLSRSIRPSTLVGESLERGSDLVVRIGGALNTRAGSSRQIGVSYPIHLECSSP